MEPTLFFYLTVAAVTFLLASLIFGGHHGDDNGNGLHHGGIHHSHGLTRGIGRGGRGSGRGGRTSQGISFFSFNTVFLFVAGFGIGGYFAATSRFPAPIVLLAGAGCGLALAAVGFYVLKFLYQRQTSSTHRLEEFVGRTGVVDVSIIGEGVGKVRCINGNDTASFLARSSGADIPRDSRVRITSIAGTVATVEAITDDDQPEFHTWQERS